MARGENDDHGVIMMIMVIMVMMLIMMIRRRGRWQEVKMMMMMRMRRYSWSILSLSDTRRFSRLHKMIEQEDGQSLETTSERGRRC